MWRHCAAQSLTSGEDCGRCDNGDSGAADAAAPAPERGWLLHPLGRLVHDSALLEQVGEVPEAAETSAR